MPIHFTITKFLRLTKYLTLFMLIVANSFFCFGEEPIRPELSTHVRLFQAAEMGDLAQLKKALDDGATISEKNAYGETALFVAIEAEEEDIVKYLLEKGSSVSVRNRANDTPLHRAVERANHEIVKYLLNYGANPKAIDRDGDTPISIAKRLGEMEILGLLQTTTSKDQ